LKAEHSGSVSSWRTSDDDSRHRLPCEPQISGALEQVKRNDVVADRIRGAERLIRILVDSSAVVEQGNGKGVPSDTTKQTRGATLAIKLRHIDPPDLERVDIGKAQRLHWEVNRSDGARARIQIRPGRRNSRGSASESRNGWCVRDVAS